MSNLNKWRLLKSFVIALSFIILIAWYIYMLTILPAKTVMFTVLGTYLLIVMLILTMLIYNSPFFRKK